MIGKYGDGRDLYRVARFPEYVPINFEFHRGMVSRCLVRNATEQQASAEEQAKKINEWFARLPDEFAERMPEELRNDLFFGFGYMLHEQGIWEYFKQCSKEWRDGLWVEEDLYYKLKEDSGGSALHELRKELSWYNRFDKLIEELDDSDAELKDYLGVGRDVFAEAKGLLDIIWAWKIAKQRYGNMNTTIPKINKSIQVQLKGDLSAKLKGRRHGHLHGPNEVKVENKLRATNIIMQLAALYGVKTQSRDRLRKA